ncbi:MAG: hypothetical protein ACFE0O_01025 [Opitutales bacterium]
MKLRHFTLSSLLFLAFLAFSFAEEAKFVVGEPLPDPDAGYTIERMGKEGFLNLQLIERRFHLFFLDADDNLMEPDKAFATIRTQSFSNEDEFFRLSRNEDPVCLRSPRFVAKPYIFGIFLSVFNPDEEDTKETYNFKYSE